MKIYFLLQLYSEDTNVNLDHVSTGKSADVLLVRYTPSRFVRSCLLIAKPYHFYNETDIRQNVWTKSFPQGSEGGSRTALGNGWG